VSRRFYAPGGADLIDKIEAMIERGTPLRGELSWLESADPFDFDARTIRKSKFYNKVADLRPMGIEAMLHFDQKKYHTSKIELLETGKKGIAEITDTMERIVDVDPGGLRLGRIDLAVDVKDVSVLWFFEHAFINFKQFHSAHGHTAQGGENEYAAMGKNSYQTLYYGKRPSCVRVYDKVAECSVRYELSKRRANRQAKKAYAEYQLANHEQGWKNLARGSPSEPVEKFARDPFLWPQFPTLQEWLKKDLPQAWAPSSSSSSSSSSSQLHLIPGAAPATQEPFCFPVLTRVENQMGGRVPGNLHSIGELRKNVRDFNPFQRMTFLNKHSPPPGFFDKVASPWGGEKYRFSVPTYCFFQWVSDNWESYGAARMRQLLNRDRNGKLYLRKLAEAGFLPDDGAPGISETELFDRYRQSISRQLAA
jgi:hypothetical protein